MESMCGSVGETVRSSNYADIVKLSQHISTITNII